MSRLTLGEAIIRWIEATCRVPEGVLLGRPLKLMEFQEREIKKIYDNPVITRRAILSMGRKGGKTTLAAVLLLAHMDGPAAIPNSQIAPRNRVIKPRCCISWPPKSSECRRSSTT